MIYMYPRRYCNMQDHAHKSTSANTKAIKLSYKKENIYLRIARFVTKEREKDLLSEMCA